MLFRRLKRLCHCFLCVKLQSSSHTCALSNLLWYSSWHCQSISSSLFPSWFRCCVQQSKEFSASLLAIYDSTRTLHVHYYSRLWVHCASKSPLSVRKSTLYSRHCITTGRQLLYVCRYYEARMCTSIISFC